MEDQLALARLNYENSFFLSSVLSVQVCLGLIIPRCIKCCFLQLHLRSPVGILLQADDVSPPAMKEALMEDFCCLPRLANPCTSAAAVTCATLSSSIAHSCESRSSWSHGVITAGSERGGWRRGNKVASLIPADSWLAAIAIAVSHYSAPELHRSELKNETGWFNNFYRCHQILNGLSEVGERVTLKASQRSFRTGTATLTCLFVCCVIKTWGRIEPDWA